MFFDNYLDGDPPLFDDVRRSSVLNLALQYHMDNAHTEHVARLALGLFDDTAAAGLEEFWKIHPNADGRGVRIALPDYGVDLFHPALMQALDSMGHPVPKVADIEIPFSINPRPVDNGDWVRFDAPVASHHRAAPDA